MGDKNPRLGVACHITRAPYRRSFPKYFRKCRGTHDNPPSAFSKFGTPCLRTNADMEKSFSQEKKHYGKRSHN